MKKILALLLVLTMVLSFAACAKTQGPTEAPATAATEAPATEPATEAPTETEPAAPAVMSHEEYAAAPYPVLSAPVLSSWPRIILTHSSYSSAT